MRNQNSLVKVHREGALEAIDAVSGAARVNKAQLHTGKVGLALKNTSVVELVERGEAWACDVAPMDLKRRTARGAVVSTGAQAGTTVLRIGALIVLARLLLKEDFGLVNMVTAFTGFLGLLMNAGLSMATIQHMSITRVQASTLFWINLAIGGLLGLLVAVVAPILAAFYGEPRVAWVAAVLGTTLVLNGAAAQHRAMLQRRMRFAVLGIIDLVSFFVSTAAGIGMAVAGYAYWALVVMMISQPAVSVLGVWLVTGWIPGMPQRRSGIQSMLRYGGALTLNNLIVYLAYNVDKVLIGRLLGVEALGIYGRASQLINLPNETLHSSIGSVAFPALSRIQNDPVRLRNYFLKGYRLVLSLAVPAIMVCALFADDIISVFLGPRWGETAGIFRLLAPGILTYAFVNPFAWLMLASGRAGRCVGIGLVVTPVLILSYALGVKHGLQGVAAGFSITMVLSIVPVLLWATRGTLITIRDILRAAGPVLFSIAMGAAVSLAVRPVLHRVDPALVRLITESTFLFGVYLLALLFIVKQKSVYIGLLREMDLWPVGNSRTSEGKV